jgi:three-Cys-motif partner protein
MKIFSTNPKAQYLDTIYVDAFAGTGYRTIEIQSKEESLFPEFNEYETTQFLKGSAQIALEIECPFSRYIFIERDLEYSKELKLLKKQFSSTVKIIEILTGDANTHLKNLCKQTDWSKNRAIFFLDPYGMEVEWQTVEEISKTRAGDMWLLFPLGIGVMRLLSKKQPPQGAWAEKLSKIFGENNWKNAFYSHKTESTLFGSEEIYKREVDWTQIKEYFVERLKTIFLKVAENPLILRNLKNSPIYLLCFAASNPRGAKTAVKIAQHILKN